MSQTITVGNRTLTPIMKIGERQLYICERGNFFVKLGEKWEQSTTMAGMRRLLNQSDGKQVKAFTSSSSYEPSEYMVERAAGSGFCRVGGKSRHSYGQYYAYDAKIVARLIQLNKVREATEAKFDRAHERIMSTATMIAEDNFDAICAEQTRKGINKV